MKFEDYFVPKLNEDKAESTLEKELLRELKSAIHYIETYGGEVTASFSAGGNMAHVKEVIAKAEGK